MADELDRRRVTLQMVAEVAGVSIATASYVLSGRVGRSDGVRDETRERVRAAAKALGYRRIQRVSTPPRTGTVLLSFLHLDDLWAQSMITAVSRALEPDGVQVIVQVGGDWQRVLAHRLADVVVVDGSTETRSARTAIGRFVARGDRLIFWSRTLPPRGFDVIRPNDAAAVTVGLDYLRARYDRVVYLDDGLSFIADRIRVEAAHRVELADRGVRVVTGGSPTLIEELLAGRHPPRAVLASTDLLGRSVAAVADRLGLEVPTDLAVLGIGDTDAVARDSPTPDRDRTLTSVGEVGGFAYVAELVRHRRTALRYEPGVHEVAWSVQRSDLTA